MRDSKKLSAGVGDRDSANPFSLISKPHTPPNSKSSHCGILQDTANIQCQGASKLWAYQYLRSHGGCSPGPCQEGTLENTPLVEEDLIPNWNPKP